MRKILDVIVDILILAMIALSGLAHMFPWVEPNSPRIVDAFERGGGDVQARAERLKRMEDDRREKTAELMELQSWHAVRSAVGLGALAFLVGISLLLNLGRGVRKVVVLLMFITGLAAVVFISLIFTPYRLTPEHPRLAGSFHEDSGFFLALIPACIATGLVLVRMIWTMPNFRSRGVENGKFGNGAESVEPVGPGPRKPGEGFRAGVEEPI